MMEKMNEEKYINWETRHPIISACVNCCYVMIWVLVVTLLTSLVVYVMLQMKDERAILELLAERLGI